MKIAVIGSGISGLGSAYLAQQQGHEVHLFEKDDYFGGHSNTILINDGISEFYADTGFLVHNPRTYPNLIALFKKLEVPTYETEMTLSIQVLQEGIEWGGLNLQTVFGQKRNLLRPRFYRMLLDILRFNRQAPEFLVKALANKNQTLGQLLLQNHFSLEMRDWYLIPMAAAIWSTPAQQILDFPAFTFLQFCMNHNLLQVEGRPTWRTVTGGSRVYVQKIIDLLPHKYLSTDIKAVHRDASGVVIEINGSKQVFDVLVFATHPEQIQKLLKDLHPDESEILSKFKYQPNFAVVHSDESFLPERKKLWSAWNYVTSALTGQVSVSYFINALQNLPTKKPIIVTLNPHKKIETGKVIKTIQYEHPVFDRETIQAQVQVESIQGRGGIHYTGAWLGYGFHEDGLRSALRFGRRMGWQAPWDAQYE